MKFHFTHWTQIVDIHYDFQRVHEPKPGKIGTFDKNRDPLGTQMVTKPLSKARGPIVYIIHYFTLMYKFCTLFVHYWSCNTNVHKVSSGKRCSHWYGCLLSSLSAAHRQGGGNVTRQLPVTCSFLNCGSYPSVLWLLVYNSNRQYTCSLGCFAKSTFQPKIKGIPSCIPPGYI